MIRYLLPTLLMALPAIAQGPEVFDTSGMPRRPSVFIEQQILDLIHSHQSGDLTDAARIQRKLARYYFDKNDQSRSRAAFLAAAEAEAGASAGTVAETDKAETASVEHAAVSAPGGTSFTGNYFGFHGQTLHTWEFHPDHTFLHTWIASRSGTSVRSSERGWFRPMGDLLEVQLTSMASGFTTPGAGGRSTVSGGGVEAAGSVRRIPIHWVVPGRSMILDGISLQLKPW
jgi:hypothetical protein